MKNENLRGRQVWKTLVSGKIVTWFTRTELKSAWRMNENVEAYHAN